MINKDGLEGYVKWIVNAVNTPQEDAVRRADQQDAFIAGWEAALKDSPDARVLNWLAAKSAECPIRIDCLVPNSDPPVWFVQESVNFPDEWENIGDGFDLMTALTEAMESHPANS